MTSSQVFRYIRQQLKINKIAAYEAQLTARQSILEAKGQRITQKALVAVKN